MLFRQIFDPTLAQYAYLIGCQQTGEALIIDPERDVDRYVEFAAAEGLKITAVAETHIHADYLSGARDLGEATGATIYVSDEGDADWKYFWADDTSATVIKVRDGDEFRIGHIHIGVLHTPGHTPEHVCFVVTDEGGGASEPMGIASGDFVFVGDLGRPDLLESAAGQVGAMEPAAGLLWESTHLLEPFAGHLQIWPGHGAGSACGKALGAVPMSTLGYERRFNASLALADRGQRAFVEGILEGQPEPPLYFARMKRDNKLGTPPKRPLGVPTELDVAGLATAVDTDGAVVIDTRPDRYDYLARHWPGAIWAPWGGANFLAIAGSYVEPEQAIVLLADDIGQAAEMTRALYRIGLDRVVGVVSKDTLWEALDLHGAATIETADWQLVRETLDSNDHQVLDVRRLSEFEAGSVAGAQNISHTRLADRLDELDRGRRLLVHCRTGFRATAAASYLEQQGFDVVHIGSKFAEWEPATADSPAR
jgi:hydroxyacylglutathione hydrolase